MLSDKAAVSERAKQLHADALIWDMVYPLEPWAGNDWDALGRFHASGYDVLSLTIAGDDQNVSDAFRRVAAARRAIRERSDRLHLVQEISDIEEARQNNKLAVGLHFEGTQCFERDIDVIEPFVQLGIRHTLIAFNAANAAGAGCAERSDGGLTAYGRRLVAEMQRAGMLLDLSHVGYRTSLDAIEVSTRPVMFSHSNADAIAPSFRNIKDDQIRACAASGGVIGISGSSSYLGDPEVRPESVFRHIDYIAQLVGAEHVALGLDVVINAEQVTAWARTRPDEWPIVLDPTWPGFRYFQPEQLPEVVQLMLDHGYSDTAVRGVLGENHRRVCETAWSPLHG